MARLAEFFIEGGAWVILAAVLALVGYANLLVQAARQRSRPLSIWPLLWSILLLLLGGLLGTRLGVGQGMVVLDQVPLDQLLALYSRIESLSLGPLTFACLAAGSLCWWSLVIAVLGARRHLSGSAVAGVVPLGLGLVGAVAVFALGLHLHDDEGLSVARNFAAFWMVTGGILSALGAGAISDTRHDSRKIAAVYAPLIGGLFVIGTFASFSGLLLLERMQALDVVAVAPADQKSALLINWLAEASILRSLRAGATGVAGLIGVTLLLAGRRGLSARSGPLMTAVFAAAVCCAIPWLALSLADADWASTQARLPQPPDGLQLPASTSQHRVEDAPVIWIDASNKASGAIGVGEPLARIEQAVAAKPRPGELIERPPLDAPGPPYWTGSDKLALGVDARLSAEPLTAAFTRLRALGHHGVKLLTLTVAEAGAAPSFDPDPTRKDLLWRSSGPPLSVVPLEIPAPPVDPLPTLGLSVDVGRVQVRGRLPFEARPALEGDQDLWRSLREHLHKAQLSTPQERWIWISLQPAATAADLVAVADAVRETPQGQPLFPRLLWIPADELEGALAALAPPENGPESASERPSAAP